jgi:thiamine biosynthesis lipoprotein
MACRFEVLLSGEDHRFVEAATLALDEATRLESEMTVFRESPVTALNRDAHAGAVRVGDELFALLARCGALWEATGGAFDVTSTPLTRCWGFFRREGRLPTSDAIAAARTAVGMDGVALDLASRRVAFTRPGLEINLGSIGKGYAVDAIAARLRASGVRHALVSAAGSSARAIGGREGGWPIDLRSRQVDGPLARLRLRDGALGTSGAGEQYFEQDGRRYGHVLDPRTGWPAAGWISATVITREATDADALATAMLVGGSALADAYCAAHPQTLVLLTSAQAGSGTIAIGAFDGAEVEAS